MTRTVLTTDQAEELEELWTEYGAALQRAMAAIRNEGKDFETFARADEQAGAALQRIKMILSTIGHHWMGYWNLPKAGSKCVEKQ